MIKESTMTQTMVEVFKTDVNQRAEALMLTAVLLQQFPFFKINFDLEDCDRILRVEGGNIVPGKIIEIMNAKGYQCLALE